jgi:hypothetical protein
MRAIPIHEVSLLNNEFEKLNSLPAFIRLFF